MNEGKEGKVEVLRLTNGEVLKISIPDVNRESLEKALLDDGPRLKELKKFLKNNNPGMDINVRVMPVSLHLKYSLRPENIPSNRLYCVTIDGRKVSDYKGLPALTRYVNEIEKGV